MLKYSDYCIVWETCNGDKSRIRKEDYIKSLENPNYTWRFDNKKICICGRSNNATFDTSFYYLHSNKDNWNWMFQEFIKLKKRGN